MDDRRQIAWVVLAACVLALVLALSIRRERPGRPVGDKPSSEQEKGGGTKAAQTDTEALGHGAGISPPEPLTAAGAERAADNPATRPITGNREAADPAVSEDDDWQPQPSVDFAAEDLEDAGGGAQVNLGEYRVRQGEEFEIHIGLISPALESVTLVLSVVPGTVELLPDSARPVGPFFRRGIEFYLDAAGGRAVLIHAGVPGKKNVNRSGGDAVVTLRARALSRGEHVLALAAGTALTNGRGGDEAYTVYGGAIEVY